MLNAIRRWIQGAVASTIVKQAAYIESLEKEADRDLDRYTRALQHNLELIQTRNNLTAENKFLAKANYALLASVQESHAEIEDLKMQLADANRYYEEADDKALDFMGKYQVAIAENKTLVERLDIQDSKVIRLTQTIEDNEEYYNELKEENDKLSIERNDMILELVSLRQQNASYKEKMTELWKLGLEVVANSANMR